MIVGTEQSIVIPRNENVTDGLGQANFVVNAFMNHMQPLVTKLSWQAVGLMLGVTQTRGIGQSGASHSITA